MHRNEFAIGVLLGGAASRETRRGKRHASRFRVVVGLRREGDDRRVVRGTDRLRSREVPCLWSNEMVGTAGSMVSSI